MKRLIQGLGAQLGAALLIAGTGAAQQNPAPPADDAAAGVAAGAGGVGGFAGMAGFGGGMAPFSDVRVLNAGAGIPVGGALLIASGTGTTTAPIVEVADVAMPSTTLGGTLTMLAGTIYWVWVPTQPLTAGTTYQVRLTAPEIGFVSMTTFEAVAAIELNKPAIDSAPSASWRSETSSWECCSSLFGSTLEQTGCFPSEQQASIMLEPGFTTSDPAVLLNQFVFRIGTVEQPVASAMLGIWPNVVVSPLYNQAEEYCFDLEAIEIVSGTVHSYADIARCAAHGELADLGRTVIEPGAAELDRVVCHAPPDVFKDEWCDMNEDPCADDAMETGCGLYGFVCEGEPLPPDPFSMTGGFAGMVGGFGAIGGASGASGIGGSPSGGAGGASGMSDDGDASVDEEGDDGETAAGDSSDSGCSVADARGGGASGVGLGYALGAAALAGAFRRRRRSA